ncbi:MAG: hypothetical protein ACYDHT_02645 [Solirubrobacteraceae bacterium]
MSVAHARQKAKLNGICNVSAIRERPTPSRMPDELEAGLAVTVFEILTAQSMAMDAKQQAALGARNDRDLLCDIRPARASRTPRAIARRSFFLFTSGRHMSMSRNTIRRPPWQLRSPTDRCGRPTTYGSIR